MIWRVYRWLPSKKKAQYVDEVDAADQPHAEQRARKRHDPQWKDKQLFVRPPDQYLPDAMVINDVPLRTMALWDQHQDEIDRKKAECYNFGWGSNDDSICSKTSRGILTSTINERGKVTHDWQTY